jgi:hypothetical protein
MRYDVIMIMIGTGLVGSTIAYGLTREGLVFGRLSARGMTSIVIGAYCFIVVAANSTSSSVCA